MNYKNDQIDRLQGFFLVVLLIMQRKAFNLSVSTEQCQLRAICRIPCGRRHTNLGR